MNKLFLLYWSWPILIYKFFISDIVQSLEDELLVLGK